MLDLTVQELLLTLYCIIHGQEVRNSNTDYGDLDELRSLDSEEEEEEVTSPKRPIMQIFDTRANTEATTFSPRLTPII